MLGAPATITQTGAVAYNNSYTASSVETLGETGNPADLVIANPDIVQPEQVVSYEVGYRGKVEKLTVDFSAYYNSYKDFISQEVVAIANGDFQAYSTFTNSSENVNSYGAAIGLSAKVFGNFDLEGSYTYTKLDFDREANPEVRLNFNTPEHKFKASFGNTQLFENFGFNVSYRFSDDYFWEANFADGVVPEFHTVDAQINYSVPSLKSTFKLGGSNILNNEYFTAVGTGLIGATYYLSWTINN